MIIQSFLPFAIPIGIFALSFCGIIALLFFNKKFFIKKFGEEKGLEMFYALDSSEFSKDDPDEKEVFGTKDYTSKRRKKFLRKKQKTFKIMNVVLIIIMVIFLILIALSIDHYKIIEEDGIYHSSWASIGEKYYPWEDFEHIYYEYGRILNDGETYHPYDSAIVVFILKDNARIELDQYSQEVNNQESQIVDFVVNKTGLSVEETIWDRSTDNHIEHSEDVIRNYKIDN